jgi:hypothetical protein
MGIHRPLLVAVLAALLLVPSAAAKEGVQALLDGPLPRAAAPGSTVTLAWTLTADRQPFGGGAIFVRLVGPAGAEFGWAEELGPGHYAAELIVPAGGIEGVELGIRGTMTRAGVSTPSDWLFTVVEPARRPLFPAWAGLALGLGALGGLAAGLALARTGRALAW